MRITERWIRDLQYFQLPLRLFPLPQESAQHRIHESRLRAEAAAFGEFHRLIHGRMIGNARKPKYLVECEAEKNLEIGLLRSARCLARDEPIEGRLLAHNPINEFLQ